MCKKNILIIDDDEISLLILQNAFKMHNFNVTITTDSKNAVQLFNTLKADAVIVDILMPNKNGFSIIADIYMLKPNCPIIAISATEKYLTKIKHLKHPKILAINKIIHPETIVQCMLSLL